MVKHKKMTKTKVVHKHVAQPEAGRSRVEKIATSESTFRELSAISFQTEHFEYREKGIFWLIGIFIIGIILLDIFFFLKLYLGMVIVILGIVVFIQRAFEKPKKIACKISKDGIVLKDRVYSYSVFKSFWISQRQPQKLYLQQTRRFLPALTILITGESDEKISFFLSQYLPKLRTTSEDFADRLASLLKF
ncbi:MAG: hypothetical protein COX39_00995 [Candidatus Nealsonbacteria bacterium CG23_combo_of_CG06-09_8_20_14_all_40_13]|uniref:DUF5673 domain-containing protein n=1 Tax=Candidatus Nealsonbacteria bacterium CG23_combo_of_CG06-09_8_20_14_all_40_13 TaxID=1974724 RepID=A0A2G9YRB5_9BACT|nr:MAG: hypothetical protein COX39_00995 [Candidatus Nealsonbacteria bacterium CG23_combo_of_CG06-09_8_20_14_all_40_13]PIU43150.1 MAG: hypothetical protein COS97_02595 [Candidatus Nealsonbacteria bacterium CG07_land_8_20_14_0_80_40_10]